jgi:hypothetical protein
MLRLSSLRPRTVNELALLCEILQALNPMASCDTQTLLDRAQCFSCLQTTQIDILKLQLLCDISASIGGSTGGGGMTCGAADPVNPPTDPTACSLYANTTNNSLWYWNNATAAWVALIV